jgi:hypothetical protein
MIDAGYRDIDLTYPLGNNILSFIKNQNFDVALPKRNFHDWLRKKGEIKLLLEPLSKGRALDIPQQGYLRSAGGSHPSTY